MQLYRGTRRWILWPCITISLIGCLFLLLFGKKQYTPNEAIAIFHQLTLQHAKEEEIIELLGSQSRLVANPANPQQERRYYFTDESLLKAVLMEARPTYDHQKRLQYFVCATQMLEGTKLWKYRFERLLQQIGM